MNGHVSTLRVEPGHIDEFAAAAQSLLPAAKQQSAGLKSVAVLGDRRTGKVVILSEWESEAAAEAAEFVAQDAFRKLGRFFAEPPIRERYEVLLQE